jgi:HD-GYP domain-containing protein (c-di-GMP phosphodiesterase class II)
MTKYLDLACEQRKFTPEEYNTIKNHSIEGSQILEKIIELNKEIIQTARQEHERIDGSGYPGGLKEKDISECAKIIGIADVYEAMVHPRPYRKAYLPLDAIKEILKNKSAFEAKIVKILIERIGFFPVGSFVELNTKEIAQVIKVNHQYPMRPVVKVIYDGEGNKLEEEKIFDLAARCNIFTTKCVSVKKDVDGKEIISK